MSKKPTKDSVYICHTYYHVFVTFLKVFNSKKNGGEKADLILSLMSTDFETLGERIKESGVFENIYYYDEKRESEKPELLELKKDRGNIVSNMMARIKFTKGLAKLQEEYIPVDLREYKDIYVYCDVDPIGYYLNQNKIYYHSVEDGLDTLRSVVQAKYTNRGHFGLKKFFSMYLNLIFIEDGYSKYCLDMEVNDISVIDDDFKKYKEVPRQALIDALTDEEKKTIIAVFVRDYEKLIEQIETIEDGKKNILILTEPLCSLDVRKQIFRDLVDEYSKEGNVYIKPHPRDELDYTDILPECIRFDKTVPMEMLNFFEKSKFDKIVSVYTELGAVKFAKEKVFLGDDFMDKYEDPKIHRMKELVDGTLKD